jgi:hypothetical protein
VIRLRAISEVDSRIHLIELKKNIGAYAAKSIGLRHCVSEYIACHDSDDWSHPEKLERQLTPLVFDHKLVATTSCWVRLTDDGKYVARQVFPLMRLNPSSTLFRRDLVLSEMGAWDVVRTGSDSEFLARLRAVFGDKAVHRVREPLAFGGVRADSLMHHPETGYDAQGRSPTREAYLQSWQAWHAQCVAERSRPVMLGSLVQNALMRPFDVPEKIEVDIAALAEVVAACGNPAFDREVAAGRRWLCATRGLAGNEQLVRVLGGQLVRPRWGGLRAPEGVSAVLAWGRKPSARWAERLARWVRKPLVRLEDGFLRSCGTGQSSPGWSLVVDELGIYYDSTRPSTLERLLASRGDVLAGRLGEEARRAKALVLQHRLSKYNLAPMLAAGSLRPDDGGRVLVVDQTAGDLSVSLGGADGATFQAMLAAARAEHPQATIYVKTHPETAAGRKGGYLAGVVADERTVLLREPVNPLSLIEQMDEVYVVSSTMGFEALLAGKVVHCFGRPWYAGWGATRDRQRCARRSRQRSVDELFAAAYMQYSRYGNPRTGQPGTIFDVIDWLVEERQRAGLAMPPAAAS